MEWPYPKGLGHYIPVAHKGREMAWRQLDHRSRNVQRRMKH